MSLLLSLTFGRNIKDIYDIFSDEIFCKSTVEASADTFFAYAYSKSGDSLTVDSAEELVSAAASYPVTIKGTINTSKYVIVENGTPRITNKSVFSSGYPQIFIYIPEITIDKAYDDMKDDVNDLVRLVDSPVSGWKLRTDYDITKGTHTGLTLSLFPEYADASAEVSTAALKMQIWDGTAWQDIWMPDGSQYNITEVIKDEPDPDISKCAGLKATVSDCSINGITGQVLADDDG
ncbi:MAG: hypothetical protein J6Y89_09305, partial [Lachnospiraceae bacterium]|nr:hypothetical protein [Lachnospiraceae bacterium]